MLDFNNTQGAIYASLSISFFVAGYLLRKVFAAKTLRESERKSKELIEAAVLLADDEANEIDNAPGKTALPKTQFTDLRRRIEERLDGKRIDHEFEYDDLDGLLDNMS